MQHRIKSVVDGSSFQAIHTHPTYSLLALALFGQAAHAGPVTPSKPTSIGASFPVVDIHALVAQENRTLPSGHRSGGLHADVDAPAGTFPAELFLCPVDNCISCFPLDLSTLPPNLCLAESFTIASILINQPSDLGFPFGVFVGETGCQVFVQVPAVNTCFSLTGVNATFTDVAIN